jgi:hypothetical protein
MDQERLLETLAHAAEALAEPARDSALAAVVEEALREAGLDCEARIVADGLDVHFRREAAPAERAFARALSQCVALALAAARRGADEVLDVHGLGHELERAAAAGRWRAQPVSLAVFEVTGLARGPGSGEGPLVSHVGALARAAVRQDDAVGNLGAGQFALLLPRAGTFEARAAFKRVREAIQGSPLARDEGLQCGAAGFAELREGLSGAGLLAEARTKMLEARRRSSYRRPRDPFRPLAG